MRRIVLLLVLALTGACASACTAGEQMCPDFIVGGPSGLRVDATEFVQAHQDAKTVEACVAATCRSVELQPRTTASVFIPLQPGAYHVRVIVTTRNGTLLDKAAAFAVRFHGDPGCPNTYHSGAAVTMNRDGSLTASR